MIKSLTKREKREKFSFKKYFKTDEGAEMLTIFNIYRKEKNLSKVEVMIKTLYEFQARYPGNDTLDRMLAHVPNKSPSKN